MFGWARFMIDNSTGYAGEVSLYQSGLSRVIINLPVQSTCTYNVVSRHM